MEILQNKVSTFVDFNRFTKAQDAEHVSPTRFGDETTTSRGNAASLIAFSNAKITDLKEMHDTEKPYNEMDPDEILPIMTDAAKSPINISTHYMKEVSS